MRFLTFDLENMSRSKVKVISILWDIFITHLLLQIPKKVNAFRWPYKLIIISRILNFNPLRNPKRKHDFFKNYLQEEGVYKYVINHNFQWPWPLTLTYFQGQRSRISFQLAINLIRLRLVVAIWGPANQKKEGV